MESSQVRQLLEAHGDCESQDVSAWTGDIPLPDAIAAFYRDVGPVDINIEGYGNPTYLPALSELWEYQAGYRWDGQTGEPIADWNPNWIVVADEGGDPYIFDGEKVLFARHGEREWNAGELFPDLNTMAAAVATVGSIILDAGDDLTDDDFNIRPEHRSAAIEKLATIVGSADDAESFLEEAGWG